MGTRDTERPRSRSASASNEAERARIARLSPTQRMTEALRAGRRQRALAKTKRDPKKETGEDGRA
ncbi:MAG: hypothetical protein HYV07_24860 [Deltaproteobacteria bacterium]|nr:hypothetical protein [Deltaproteobacteria bacterium]